MSLPDINVSISEVVAGAITTLLANNMKKDAEKQPTELGEMRQALADCLPMLAHGLEAICDIGNFDCTSNKNALVLVATPEKCFGVAYDLAMLLEQPEALVPPPEADMKTIWGAVHHFLDKDEADRATFAVLLRAGVEQLRSWQAMLTEDMAKDGPIPILAALTVRELKEPDLERCGGNISLVPFPAKSIAFLHALAQAEQEKGSGATIN